MQPRKRVDLDVQQQVATNLPDVGFILYRIVMAQVVNEPSFGMLDWDLQKQAA